MVPQHSPHGEVKSSPVPAELELGSLFHRNKPTFPLPPGFLHRGGGLDERLQRPRGQRQSAVHLLMHHVFRLNAEFEQLKAVAVILRAHQHANLGIFLAHLRHQPRHLGLVRQRDDQHAGLLDARRMQQIEPCGIAIKHLEAKGAQHVHMIGISFQNRHIHPLRHHETSQEIAEAAKSGQDHRRMLINRVGSAFHLAHRRVARGNNAFIHDEQQRRHRHGECHDGHEQLRILRVENLLLRGHRQQCKGKLTALRQRQQPATSGGCRESSAAWQSPTAPASSTRSIQEPKRPRAVVSPRSR